MTKLVLKVKGMHCASCAILIDKLIGKQPGEEKINASYGAEKVTIEFDEAKISLVEIDKLINQLGYDLIRPNEAGSTLEEEEQKEVKQIKEAGRRALIAFIISAPIVVYYMLIHMFNLKHVHEIWGLDLNYVYWILSTPVQFFIAWPFYRNAYTALRVGAANMDVLVVLGTSAAYFYSAVGFLFFNIDHPFWESSAALLSFILLGRYIEVVGKGRASAAVKELLQLEAKEAHVMRNGKEVTIAKDTIQKGDIVVVRPGEKIPVDGVIVEGKTHIDEKVVTGESFPVGKGIDDEVIGATVNQEGLIKFKALKVGKDTMLHQIINMVEEAQARRAPIQNLVDKISERFVPAVIVLAVLVFVGWFLVAALPFRTGLLRMIAVLVISCPCAMGLATPTALVAGIGRATKFGIILKGGEALEKAYKVSAVALDKTGTLTIGKPVITNFVPMEGINKKEALALIAAVETGSEHPLARAIVAKGKEVVGELPEAENIQADVGMGIQGTVPGKKVAIGNVALMESLRISVKEHTGLVETLQNEAKTVVYAVSEEKLIAIVAMADTLKPYAKEAIQALQKMKKEIIMRS